MGRIAGGPQVGHPGAAHRDHETARKRQCPALAVAHRPGHRVGGDPEGAVRLPAGLRAERRHGVAQAHRHQGGSTVRVDPEIMVFGFEREQAPPGEFRRVSSQKTPRRAVGLRTLGRSRRGICFRRRGRPEARQAAPREGQEQSKRQGPTIGLQRRGHRLPHEPEDQVHAAGRRDRGDQDRTGQ